MPPLQLRFIRFVTNNRDTQRFIHPGTVAAYPSRDICMAWWACQGTCSSTKQLFLPTAVKGKECP